MTPPYPTLIVFDREWNDSRSNTKRYEANTNHENFHWIICWRWRRDNRPESSQLTICNIAWRVPTPHKSKGGCHQPKVCSPLSGPHQPSFRYLPMPDSCQNQLKLLMSLFLKTQNRCHAFFGNNANVNFCQDFNDNFPLNDVMIQWGLLCFLSFWVSFLANLPSVSSRYWMGLCFDYYVGQSFVYNANHWTVHLCLPSSFWQTLISLTLLLFAHFEVLWT